MVYDDDDSDVDVAVAVFVGRRVVGSELCSRTARCAHRVSVWVSCGAAVALAAVTQCSVDKATLSTAEQPSLLRALARQPVPSTGRDWFRQLLGDVSMAQIAAVSTFYVVTDGLSPGPTEVGVSVDSLPAIQRGRPNLPEDTAALTPTTCQQDDPSLILPSATVHHPEHRQATPQSSWAATPATAWARRVTQAATPCRWTHSA